jgi:hypothetical protein
LLLLFGPSPIPGLEKTDLVLNRIRDANIAKAEKAARKQEIDAAEASGVVQVGISPPKDGKKP